MPSIFPQGRVGTARFCAIAGISRTTFLTRYRRDPRYIRQFDIRVDALGRLNMSEVAARDFGDRRAGRPAHGNAGRFRGRPCPGCAQDMPNRADACRLCGFEVRWRCNGCGSKSPHAEETCSVCATPRDPTATSSG